MMEPIIRHILISSFLLLFIFLPSAALTQHLWHPFERDRFETLMQAGDTLVATIELHVLRRYKVQFRERLVHVPSGAWHHLRSHGSLTGQIGEFTLIKTFDLPENYQAGRWCHITEYEIRYNLLNTQFGSYQPACVEVQQKEE